MRRRRSRSSRSKLLLLMLVVAVAAVFGLLYIRIDAAPFFSSSPAGPHVLLLTTTPRCSRGRGQFFLTKALQSKLSFAREQSSSTWEVWALGEGELWAAAHTMLLQGAAATKAILWPSLMLQVLARLEDGRARHVDWIVWMEPEVLCRMEVDLPWREWAASDMVLVKQRSGSSSSSSSEEADGMPVLSDVDFSVAFVKATVSVRAFLSEWLDELTVFGADGTASAVRAFGSVLRAHTVPPLRVKVVDARAKGLLGELGRETDTPLPQDDGSDLPWLTTFRDCDLCSAADTEDTDVKTSGGSFKLATSSCERALMRRFTALDDRVISTLGAQHTAPGSVHVRPSAVEHRSGIGWLQEHRGGLGRCLPSLLVVGSQRAALGSIGYCAAAGIAASASMTSGIATFTSSPWTTDGSLGC
jgi:hypothetical protein